MLLPVTWVNLIPYPERKRIAIGVVYVVSAPLAGLHKIGWSANLHQRLVTLGQSEHDIPGPFKLIHTIDTGCGDYLERQLHMLFRHRYNVREWFRLTRSDVQWIKSLGSVLSDGIPVTADVVPPLAEWGG